MSVDPNNSQELVTIAGEIGADVLTGTLRYPSDTGSWQLGAIDLGEYLDRYRNQRLVLIIAALGEADPMTYTCGVCGFMMNEAGECPRCKLTLRERAHEWEDTGEERSVFDQVKDLLADLDAQNTL